MRRDLFFNGASIAAIEDNKYLIADKEDMGMWEVSEKEFILHLFKFFTIYKNSTKQTFIDTYNDMLKVVADKIGVGTYDKIIEEYFAGDFNIFNKDYLGNKLKSMKENEKIKIKLDNKEPSNNNIVQFKLFKLMNVTFIGVTSPSCILKTYVIHDDTDYLKIINEIEQSLRGIDLSFAKSYLF